MLIKKYFLAFVNIIIINIRFFYSKCLKKKTILFFHPVDDLTRIHNFYLKKMSLNKLNSIDLIHCHKNFQNIDIFNHKFITYLSLRFIFFCDVFVSNNISDIFPPFSKKVYIHHSIYDTPLVEEKKESEIEKRLSKYNYILISCSKVRKVFENLFKNYQLPILMEMGYLRFSYLSRKIKDKYQDNRIVIAPTGIDSFKNLSIKKKLIDIINMLQKNQYFVVLRPHPRDIQKKFYLNLNKKILNKKKYLYDKSKNYMETFENSEIMLTDLSGTAYTYAFLTKKPVIFYSINEKKNRVSNYSNLNFFLDRKKIGEVVFDIQKIITAIKKCKKNKKKIKKTINLMIKNNRLFLNSYTRTLNFLSKI
jgi:hypothetical protein